MPEDATRGGEAYAQHDRAIAIDTKLGPDAILLIDLDGDEKLSHCFTYTIRFVTQRSDPEVRSLLGQPVTVWLGNNDEQVRRPINGRIRRIVSVADTLHDFTTYQAEVVPQIWFLDCTADCRIFQDQAVPDIIRTVLQDHGVADFEFRLLKKDYPKLDYCVQYRESALAFIARLMEDVGIFYCHEHHADRHVLVMLDANQLASRSKPQQLRMSQRGDLGEIQLLRTDTAFRPGRWALTDFDFQAPSKIMRKHVKTVLAVHGMDQREIFDYPGGYVDQAVGDWLTRLRMEAEEAQHLRVLGTSSLATLDPGQRIQVTSGAQAERSEPSYLLTEVHHRAWDHSYFSSAEGEPSHYENDFVAIPQTTQFRPQRITPKPVVYGPQTATVVSPDKGDPIFTDMYGRIKVHFHWDRRGDRSKGNTSCWLRVSQVNAGSSAGSVSIPHAGQEVVVAFLEGDPDRPLVVGRLHNAEKLPPLVLPRDKHKTEIRDHGNNKLIMHGKPGQEHLSLVTPRSLNMVAMRPPARSLSSGAAAEFGDIEDWQDSTGLNEVKTIFNALTQYQSHPPTPSLFGPTPVTTSVPPVSDPNPTGLTLAGPGNVDDTGALGIDINTFTDGRANVVTLGNNNTWCYGGYNTWVHGWANSKYCGGNYQEIGGGPGSPASNIQIVWGDNTQQTLGASEQFTEGASVSTVLGGSAQLIVGGSLQMILPLSMIINMGMQYTVCTADEQHLTLDNGTTCAAWTVTAASGAITSAAAMAITATAAVNITGATMMQIAPVFDIVAAATFMATSGGSSISMLPAITRITSAVIAVKGALIQLG
jgi:type VI secretion system secreted protein VgrG